MYKYHKTRDQHKLVIYNFICSCVYDVIKGIKEDISNSNPRIGQKLLFNFSKFFVTEFEIVFVTIQHNYLSRNENYSYNGILKTVYFTKKIQHKTKNVQHTYSYLKL